MSALLQRMGAALLITTCIVVYYVTSAGSGIWNKQLVDASGSGVSPTVLTLLHLLVSLGSDVAIMRLSSEGMPKFPPEHGRHSAWDIVTSFGPISVFVILSKLTTYVSYQHVSVALSHTAKASEPIFNVIIAAVVFGEYHTHAVYASLVPIALGVGLASITDFSYNHAGFFWAIASALMKVLQNIYTKRLMNTGKFTFWEIHLYCGAASLLMLLPVMVVELCTAVANPFSHFPFFQLFECSILQYVSSVSSYMVLNLVSHLTFTIVNVTKRLFIIISGTIFDGVSLRPLNVFGVTIAMLGILVYNLVKDMPAGTAGPSNPWSVGSWAVWLMKLAWKYNHPSGEGLVSPGARKRHDDADGDSFLAGASAPREGSDDVSALRIHASREQDGSASMHDTELRAGRADGGTSDASAEHATRRSTLLHSTWDSPISGTPIKYPRSMEASPAMARDPSRVHSSGVAAHARAAMQASSVHASPHTAAQGDGTWSWQGNAPRNAPAGVSEPASSASRPSATDPVLLDSGHALQFGGSRAVDGNRAVPSMHPADQLDTRAAVNHAREPSTLPPSPNWAASFSPHAGTIGVVQRGPGRGTQAAVSTAE